jgi:hypothetical protein
MLLCLSRRFLSRESGFWGLLRTDTTGMTCGASKMIFLTYKSDVHPVHRRDGWNVGGACKGSGN